AALARRRRGGLARAARRNREDSRPGGRRRRLCCGPPQRVPRAVDPPRRALSGLAGAPVPPWPRALRRSRRARVGGGGGPCGSAERSPRPPKLRGRVGLLRPGQSLLGAGGPGAGAGRGTSARPRARAAPARPLPVDVPRAARLPRRAQRSSSGRTVRVLCVHAYGQSLGGHTRAMKKTRVLSGMRPTGKLHLGNYLGALDNWVRMQDEFDCFFFVANWLGAGLGPERSTRFIQSLVPEHAELHLLFSMVTPVAWLERVPTYKEMVEQLGLESPSYGLLGYPLLQAADILMYKPAWVP